jgi:hypothetical protein
VRAQAWRPTMAKEKPEGAASVLPVFRLGCIAPAKRKDRRCDRRGSGRSARPSVICNWPCYLPGIGARLSSRSTFVVTAPATEQYRKRSASARADPTAFARRLWHGPILDDRQEPRRRGRCGTLRAGGKKVNAACSSNEPSRVVPRALERKRAARRPPPSCSRPRSA